MRKAKLFLLNTFFITISTFIIKGIYTYFNIYISNKIGTETLGIYQLVMSIYFFAITIATSGINLASTRIISEELALNSNKNIKKAVKTCLLYSLFFSILAAFLLFIFSPIICINYLHNKLSPNTLYILALTLPFISMSASINGYFCAKRKIIKNISSNFIEQFIKISVSIFLINNLFDIASIESACLALAIAELACEICSFTFIFFLYINEEKYHDYLYNKNYFSRIIKIAIPVAITSYIRSGLSSLKQILIPLRLEKFGLSCAYSLSIYGMVNGMAMPIIMFPALIIMSCSNLLIPEFSTFYIQKRNTLIGELTSHIFKITSIFSIGCSAIFMYFADKISLTFYNNLEISYFIKCFSFLVLFIYMDIIIDIILKALDKQVAVMVLNIVDLFISIFFIYFIVPIYGINAYIAIIFISEILNFSISFIQLRKCFKMKFNFKAWIVKPIFCSITSCFFMDTFFYNIDSLFMSILLFTLVYFLLLFLSSCITKKDFTFIFSTNFTKDST